MGRVGLTTEGVVREAAALVDAEGPGALRVAALAARVGVRPASIYAHVASLEEIRLGVTALALAELADRVGEAVAGRAGTDAVAAYAEAVRAYAAAHPGRYAATRLRVDDAGGDGTAAIEAGRRDGGLRASAIEAGRRNAGLARAVLRGYGLEGEREVHAVRLLGSVVHGYVDLELSGAFDHSDPPSATSWPVVVAALDAALRTV